MNNSANITKDQLICINTIISKMKLSPDAKGAMVNSFSYGRCTSSKDLTSSEALQMIQHLKREQGGAADDDQKSKMVGKIFYYAHEMRWTKINSKGKKVADGKRIDEWMIKYSYLRKKLSRYSYSELPKLVSQFESVYKHFLKSI